MIELTPGQLPAHQAWFPTGVPGTAALAEHVLATGRGRWWADRATEPRALAVAAGGYALLRGDPGALTEPGALAVLAEHYVRAPAAFGPVLRGAFESVVPWERMVYVHEVRAASRRLPRGTAVRGLTPGDADALAGLDSAWIHGTWGGPEGLAGSGRAVGAFRRGRLVAVACSHVCGSAYEDIAVHTDADHRRQGFALACAAELTRHIAARGRTASWTCSRDHRISRQLAWAAGFRLRQEYVHFVTGRAVDRAVQEAA